MRKFELKHWTFYCTLLYSNDAHILLLDAYFLPKPFTAVHSLIFRIADSANCRFLLIVIKYRQY